MEQFLGYRRLLYGVAAFIFISGLAFTLLHFFSSGDYEKEKVEEIKNTIVHNDLVNVGKTEKEIEALNIKLEGQLISGVMNVNGNVIRGAYPDKETLHAVNFGTTTTLYVADKDHVYMKNVYDPRYLYIVPAMDGSNFEIVLYKRSNPCATEDELKQYDCFPIQTVIAKNDHEVFGFIGVSGWVEQLYGVQPYDLEFDPVDAAEFEYRKIIIRSGRSEYLFSEEGLKKIE